LLKQNELKRERARKKKEQIEVRLKAADEVLDKRNPNPLLLETFGARYTERQELSRQQLMEVKIPTYDNIPPPLQVVNVNLKRAKGKLLREVQSTKALLAATAPYCCHCCTSIYTRVIYWLVICNIAIYSYSYDIVVDI
jgi:hypothetical protein